MTSTDTPGVRKKKPIWLRQRLPSGAEYEDVKQLLKKRLLNTVCQEAICPNRFECFSRHTATFLILGSKCTRNCRFCAVEHGPIKPPDLDEPLRVAQAALKLNLKYIVITSVTRDDLSDGGASLFAETISEIRKKITGALIEILIPDFQGDATRLKMVLDAKPDVLNHNVETVPRLYEKVRPEASYQRSLTLLKTAKSIDSKIPTKSGLMLGLGETFNEIIQTLKDLFKHDCEIVTLGQYLQPSRTHLPVQRFIPPEEFAELKKIALDIGFAEAASGPFVRSSYNAKELYYAAKNFVN